MSIFYYKCKGSADDIYSVGTLVANDKKDAQEKLDKIYGSIEIQIIDKDSFTKLEKENGKQLTHRPEVE